MKQKNKPAIMLLLFIVLVALAVSVCILVLPDDLPKLQPDNTGGNIKNGGEMVGNDEIFYFAQDGKIYSLFDKKVSVICDGDAPLFITNGGVIYGENGSLYQYISENYSKTPVLETAENPVIIGRWVYYTDGGEIVKQRLDDKKSFRLGLYTNGNYYVSASSVYYLSPDGYLYSAKTDGSGSEKMSEYKMQDFTVGGNYVFFKNDSGKLCWFAASAPAAVVEHETADNYNYVAGYAVYTREGQLYSYDLSSDSDLTEKIIYEESVPGGIYTDSSYVYFGNTEGELVRMLPDGSECETFKVDDAS